MEKVTKTQVKDFVIENCIGSMINLDCGDVDSIFTEKDEIEHFMYEEPMESQVEGTRVIEILGSDKEMVFEHLEHARAVLLFIHFNSADEVCLTMEDMNGLNELMQHCGIANGGDVETKWGLNSSDDCPYALRLHLFVAK